MPYPTKLLNDHEEVVADLHPHWWYFWKSVGSLALVLVLGVIVLATTDNSFVITMMLVLILVSAIWVITAYVGWVSTNFVVTNQRVIYRSGIVTKSGIEIPLDRVVTVHFRQGVIERILGAGDLLIESAGEQGQQRFTDVRDPARVQQLIHQQGELRESQRLGRSVAAPAPVADVASQLEKLEGMLERGTLTRAEFDAQKQRLLGD